MDLGDRCLVYRHVPITSSGYNNHVHILQSPGYVAIFQEQIHDFRIIPVFEQPELPDQVRLWLGVSRGHWEGDTLVVSRPATSMRRPTIWVRARTAASSSGSAGAVRTPSSTRSR